MAPAIQGWVCEHSPGFRSEPPLQAAHAGQRRSIADLTDLYVSPSPVEVPYPARYPWPAPALEASAGRPDQFHRQPAAVDAAAVAKGIAGGHAAHHRYAGILELEGLADSALLHRQNAGSIDQYRRVGSYQLIETRNTACRSFVDAKRHQNDADRHHESRWRHIGPAAIAQLSESRHFRFGLAVDAG